MRHRYDAVLLVSFGGPERLQDVVPFLENVVRGKDVPRRRVLEVARRYELFDGVSPINAQNRALVAALVTQLNARGPELPVYWGNRNWHPLLSDALRQMADDGIGRALAFVTSPYGSYPTCRQYQEDIDRARQAIGAEAPQVDKLRPFYNHPGFIEPVAERVAAALEGIPGERRSQALLLYTAHSIPLAMAEKSPYQAHLSEACRLVSERVGRDAWRLAYQSRSGPPSQPWLEPDVKEVLHELAGTGEARDVVIVPIGFLCEHVEILYDLDVEVADLCGQLGLTLVRARLVGTHPRFVTMIRQLILERLEEQPTRLALGTLGPSPDVCPPDCCPSG